MPGVIATALLNVAKTPPNNVAIFSSDRKMVQGKQNNVIGKTFSSSQQAGKINTFSVSPEASPQNPNAMWGTTLDRKNVT